MLIQDGIKNITEDERYARYVNPEWVRLIKAVGLNKKFVRARGSELLTAEGEVYLDFLSGYGVYNVGHHHPYIAEQLIQELSGQRPSMLQSHVPSLAAELAERLCKKAGGKLEKVYFGSSGSEGVESAIKFSRAHTKRNWILFAEGGFHGLTYGALSLMSNPWWKEGFGPTLQETKGIPFGDLEQLEAELKTKKFAAFILEPIQGETGVILPPPGYLKAAEDLCARYGTLFVLDEVQTGFHRTGPFIAAQHYGVNPDMVILAKALSGGHVPVSALLMRSDINRSVYKSVDKAFVHASTFSENALAMRAGLATLDVLEMEDLGTRSTTLGEKLRSDLTLALKDCSIVKEIRGIGLFNAIEFKAPAGTATKLLYLAFTKAHPGLFGQMVIRQLFEEGKILSQMAGNNFSVIKSLPALTISEAQLERYVQALTGVLHGVEKEKSHFWTQGFAVAKSVLLN